MSENLYTLNTSEDNDDSDSTSYVFQDLTCELNQMLAALANPYGPTSEERGVLMAEVVRHEDSIRALDVKLCSTPHDTDESLVFLRKKLVDQIRLVDLKESLCAPIRRIPPEILISVLEYLHDLSFDANSTRNLYLPSPLLLTHVCRYWRELVKNAPTLWTHMCFSTATGQPLPMLLDKYLEYSKPLPIHISLKILEFSFPYEKLQHLRRALNRCASFEIDFDVPNYWHHNGGRTTLFPGLTTPAQMPFLKSLKLPGFIHLRPQIEAPLLKSVELRDTLAVEFCRILTTSSTTSLTRLILDGVSGSIAEVGSVLAQSPNLQFCQLGFAGLSLPETTNVLLSSLQDLSITWVHVGGVENLLRSINAPSLRSLSLLPGGRPPPLMLLSFLTTPTWTSIVPQLQNLALTNFNLGPFVQTILPRCSNLERLVLRLCQCFTDVVQFYANTVEEDGDSTILQIQRSSLRILEVSVYSLLPEPSESKLLLTKMIKAGIQHGKLRTVVLRLDKFFTKAERLDLQAAVVGMDIPGVTFDLN